MDNWILWLHPLVNRILSIHYNGNIHKIGTIKKNVYGTNLEVLKKYSVIISNILISLMSMFIKLDMCNY